MLEIIRPGASAAEAKVALFDFDGTLSLIRTGWMKVMVPMMVEELVELRTGESEADLQRAVEDFVWRLTGKETIYQMIALAEEIQRRGGVPHDPKVYKTRYLDRLWSVIRDRIGELRAAGDADRYLVPGARALLESLQMRGLQLYLASGTDEEFVQEEAHLLNIARYFDGGIFGARDDCPSWAKRTVIERILKLPGVDGLHLLGFGDGYVEIEEVKRVGGVAVGVATDEPLCREPDQWKRRRLIGVGADYIIPNFLCRGELLQTLFS